MKQGRIYVSKIMRNRSCSSIFETSIFHHLKTAIRWRYCHIFPIAAYLDFTTSPLMDLPPLTLYLGFPGVSPQLSQVKINFWRGLLLWRACALGGSALGAGSERIRGPDGCWLLPYFTEWHWLDLARLTSLNTRGSKITFFNYN